jgi:endonuclease G, mitochondrial
MPGINDGYRKDFLGKDHQLKLPVLNAKQKKDLVKFGVNKSVLDYIHYSATMSKTRRFAFFTAVNIDGTTWKNNPRKGSWKKDDRISFNEQFGRELYGAMKDDFDQGHLVRREDPEWGENNIAEKAGENTFMYPNCVPQHQELNRKIWEELENNILHKGSIDQKLKVSVFTGPVLSDNDGIFIKKVNDQEVKIPSLFWKIVTWVKTDGKTYAVGFIQSQEKFLIEGGIIKKLLVPGKLKLRELTDEDIFEHLKFKDGKTYQVSIAEIETLTGLVFDWPGVVKPYTGTEPAAISIKTQADSNNRPMTQDRNIPVKMKLDLEGLVLE